LEKDEEGKTKSKTKKSKDKEIQTKINQDVTQNFLQVFGSIIVFHKISIIFG